MTTIDTTHIVPRAVVVMGVSGSGKTVAAQALAKRLGWHFIEGDRLQPPENIARMSAGLPLTDDLRAGWLDTVGRQLATTLGKDTGAVAACSALKAAYRERLRGIAGDILFVHLIVSPSLARERVTRRRGHFMPANLVDSQFADLEPPRPGERAITVSGDIPVERIVDLSIQALGIGHVL